VPRVENKWIDGVGATRSFLARCVIDKTNCKQGIKRLDNYKKTWNTQLGAWRNEPAHDENCHGADALETGARGFTPAVVTRASGSPFAGATTWRYDDGKYGTSAQFDADGRDPALVETFRWYAERTGNAFDREAVPIGVSNVQWWRELMQSVDGKSRGLPYSAPPCKSHKM
jgi:hypothetical protein